MIGVINYDRKLLHMTAFTKFKNDYKMKRNKATAGKKIFQ